MSKVHKSVMSLKHYFSEEEKEQMTQNVCHNIQEITNLEYQKKLENKKYADAIGDLEEKNKVMAEHLIDGYADQDTAVEIQFNHPEPGIKTVTRMDTNEQWTMEMEQEEYNLFHLNELEEVDA